MIRKLIRRITQGRGNVRYVEPTVDFANDEEIDIFVQLIRELANRGHFALPLSDEQEASYAKELQGFNQALLAKTQSPLMTMTVSVYEEPIGLYVLKATEDPGILELHVLVILPVWMGRGFGRFVLEHAISQAEQSGKRLMVRCFPASERMISMLQRRGFVEVDSPGQVTVRTFLAAA